MDLSLFLNIMDYPIELITSISIQNAEIFRVTKEK